MLGAVSELVCVVAYGVFSVMGVVTFIAGVLYHYSIATATPRERARAGTAPLPRLHSAAVPPFLALSLSLSLSLFDQFPRGMSVCHHATSFMRVRPAPDPPTHPHAYTQCWPSSWWLLAWAW